MSPVLNLTEFEEPTYEAIPAGKYFATVFDAEDREVGEGGKTPEGTPMLWCHFIVTGKVGDDDQGEDSPYYNKRAFRNLVIPPEDYDERKKKAMNGMLVQLFRAVGYTEEEITSGTFEIDAEDLIEKELVIHLNRRPNRQTKEMENNVTGFFTVDSVSEEGTEAASGVV